MRTGIAGLFLSCLLFCSTTFGAVGSVEQKVWLNQGGIDTLDQAIAFVQAEEYVPDFILVRSELTWNGVGGYDDYVSKTYGWITPPATGDYIFYLSSDDEGALFLSSNASEPTGDYICSLEGDANSQWSGYQGYYAFPEQISDPVTLEAGKYYRFYVAHCEGYGGDHQSVAWTGPGISSPTVIANEYIRSNADIAGGVEPVDGADNVKDGLLSWFEPTTIEAVSYNVTLFADPNIEYTGITATELDLGNIGNGNLLQYNTEYTWRVDAVEADNTVHKGERTTFTTNNGIPTITSQPGNNQAKVGKDASFSIAAESIDPSTISYEWFKVKESGDVSVGTGNVLEITEVEYADKGSYYCTVSNDIGSETSNTVTLFVTRGLVHRFSFTDDPNDYVGGAVGKIIAPNNNVTIENGQAVFTNNSGYSSNSGNIGYIDLPNGMISSLGKEFTFIIWFTWGGPETQNWERVFDFGSSNEGEDISSGGNTSNYIFLTPRADALNNPMRFGFTNNAAGLGEKVVNWTQPAPVNTEICVAITWSEFDNKSKVYVNGASISDGTALHVTLAEFNDVNNWLGRAQWDDAGFTGSINEFRIYDEALSPEWITEHYTTGADEVPTNACIDSPTADVNGDCRVNLEDLGMLAAEWLACGWLDCD